MKRMLALGALALFTVSAMAQDKPAAKAAKPADKKAPAAQGGGMPPMPKPSADMQKMIKAFGGKWNVVVKTEAAMGMPASESKGDASFSRGPGGLSLIEEFRSQGGMGNFRGHGVVYWDEKAKSFTGIWCDSMTPSGCSNGGSSKWDGDKVVGTMEMPDEKGQMAKFSLAYTDIKPDSFTFTMNSPDGKPMMTINYTRAAAAAPAAKKD